MAFKFGKNADDAQGQEAAGEKKNQNALLVLLLILVGGFSYVYFFTGLIKPQETVTPAEAPAAALQAVKMPLPARDGDAAKPDEKAAVKAEVPKAAPTQAALPAKPAAPPVAKAAVAAATAAKPKEEPKKVEPVKTDKKPQAAPVAATKSEKTTQTKADVKKAAAPEKKAAPVKNSAKKPADDDQAKPEQAAAKKSTAGAWTVTVGNYVLEETLSADMGRVRKAGLEAVVKPSMRQKTAMNRLFLSEFNDRASAQAILEKLKRHTSAAFVIEQGGTFSVYAGSYAQRESAGSEKERLKSAGFATTVKSVEIAIPSQSLTVGPFTSKKAADAALGKLKAAGIKATLSNK